VAGTAAPSIAADRSSTAADLLVVPTLPRSRPLRIIDFGSGETGFYEYGSSDNSAAVRQVGDKLKGGLLDDWVGPNKVDELVYELLQRYEASAESSIGELVFVSGATGVNRERMLAHQHERNAVQAYSRAVEARLSTVFGGRTCRFIVFVPSGQQEARYELRAVEWLLEQSCGRAAIPACASTDFAGTLSAGGGSSQLSVRSSSGEVQLYSVPLGNKRPISEGLFSNRPTEAEVASWIGRYREGLRQATFPTGLRGLFIGISATYYAAKESSCADRVMTKGEVIAAFSTKIEGLLAQAGNAGDDATEKCRKSMANMSLVRELLNWVLHDDARILFRRNWKVGDQEAVATWTLGLYGEAEAERRG
jgi:hypothetical protein